MSEMVLFLGNFLFLQNRWLNVPLRIGRTNKRQFILLSDVTSCHLECHRMVIGNVHRSPRLIS
uniref:Uncharacterized protein n=1 Tax=Onchocerca volvulus TaxID=6282 RepID=A0A8R1Y7G5_ONCVO